MSDAIDQSNTRSAGEVYLHHFIACVVLVCAGAALHVWYLLVDCPLDLAGDEAHYWEWARRPLDLSYYSKGPLVAYVIATGRYFFAEMSERLLGNETLAVRLPAIVLSVITALGIYLLAQNVLRRSGLALATVALTFTVPILAVGAILMTIDAPFVAAWTWSLVVLHRAVHHDRVWQWVVAGLLIAIGILAKYTMLLIFPAVGLLLLTDPTARRLLKRPGPYVSTVIGLSGLIPIAVWNAQHGWVSFRHVAGQAGVSEGPGFDPMGVLVYLGGQAGVLNALWFIGMIWAIINLWRQPVDTEHEIQDRLSIRLLLWAAVVPWGVFLLFSPITKIQPNWPVVSVVPGLILMTLWLTRRLRLPTKPQRNVARGFITTGIVFGLAMVLVMHRTAVLMPMFGRLAQDAPPWELTPVAKYDPTARLRGWSELGAAVGEVLQAQQEAGQDTFILTDDYQLAGQIAFYCPGEPVTYCVQSALGGRLSQYDIWVNPITHPERFLGRPCVYIGSLHEELQGDEGSSPILVGLERVRTVEHFVEGHRLRIWSIYVSERFNGFDRSHLIEQDVDY